MNVNLVVFDVDGVLVEEPSSWEYLHDYFKAKSLSKQVYELMKNGKITYYEWMYLDTMIWGQTNSTGYITKQDLVQAFEKITINREMIDVARKLSLKGKKIVLLSGGIDILVKKIAEMIPSDQWISNILVFDEHERLVPGGIPVVPPGSKGIHMRMLKAKYNVTKENTVFIGDSIWDKEAFAEAGLSILFGDYLEQLDVCVKTNDPTEVLELINEYEQGILAC